MNKGLYTLSLVMALIVGFYLGSFFYVPIY